MKKLNGLLIDLFSTQHGWYMYACVCMGSSPSMQLGVTKKAIAHGVTMTNTDITNRHAVSQACMHVYTTPTYMHHINDYLLINVIVSDQITTFVGILH